MEINGMLKIALLTLAAAFGPSVNGGHVKSASPIPYLVTIVVIILLGVVSVLGVTLLLPNKDNTIIITMIIGLLVPTLGTLLTFFKAQETHVSVNSRMDEMKNLIQQKAFAEGMAAMAPPQAPPAVVVVNPPPTAAPKGKPQ